MPIDYHQPATLEEAWRIASTVAGARFIAGGTDVMVRIREGKAKPSALVSLTRIADLARIEVGPPLVIGAGVRIADLESTLGAALPALAMAARTLGSAQIRNVATVGGNLCNASPCADLAPPLLVHDARVRLASPRGSRELPLRDFFVGPRASVLAPDEVLVAIVVDDPSVPAVFLKKGRVAMDIAIASVAAAIRMDGSRCVRARLAAGSVGPTPMRLPDAERALEGRVIGDAAIADARDAAQREVRPISDVRAGAEYRRMLVGAFVERGVRALLLLVGGDAR